MKFVFILNSGARCGEVTGIFIEDMEEQVHNGVTFLRMPLRSSKSNTFKDRREALILPLAGESAETTRHWIKVIKGGRASGKLFQNSTTAKVRSHFQTAQKAFGWKRAPTGHSLRIHFVVTALESGASEQDIQNICRWKSGDMINV
jgi:hypothetical protein